LTASKVKYRADFGPFLPGVYHLPFDNPYRPVDAMGAAEALFKTKVSPKEVAAVIMEPIQGEGGYVPPSPEFIRAWRKICDDNGIVLIFDEIQSGVGRTGKMWACENYGVSPDILLTAKGLGSGMPIGAIIAKESVMTWPKGSHGTTFGGNPVCCAAALATLDAIENENLMGNAKKIGERLIKGFKELQKRHDSIGDVRGMGLMIGVEFIKNKKTKEADHDLAYELEQRSFRKGLLLLSCGESTIRIAPPLVLTEYDADMGLQIIDEVLTELGR
jgi:4-aminobutyrate aminotransferase